MFVYFCPECKTRYYILPSDRYGQECKCLNCGKVFHLHFVDCVEEFEEDKYPEGWQKL